MKKIEIRGIIVPPEFEDETLSDFIGKGLFTPTSKVERELEEAEKNGEDVRLYVNSEGGDVLAGNALLDRIRAYPHGLTVECGALVASEAANIVAQLADSRPVECHPNTIFLWHSARSEIEAGPDALRDEARFLDLVNAPIKAILIAHGVPPYSVERGFSEGREYLMGADEAVEYGIVSRIIGGSETGTAPTISREQAETILSAVNTRFPLAAYATAHALNYNDMAKRNAKKAEIPEEEEKQNVETVETEEVKTEETKVDETPTTEETKTEETETTEETKTETAEPETEETEDTRRIRELEEKVETLTKELDELREENARKTEEANAARTEAKANASTVATLRAELAASEKRRNALVGRVLSNAGEGSTSEPKDWREAVKACGSPSLAFDKYPHLARAWRDTH